MLQDLEDAEGRGGVVDLETPGSWHFQHFSSVPGLVGEMEPRCQKVEGGVAAHRVTGSDQSILGVAENGCKSKVDSLRPSSVATRYKVGGKDPFAIIKLIRSFTRRPLLLDHCYFELSVSGPLQIRRLDEFAKNGNAVEVRVFIYSRKSDLPPHIQKQLSGFVDGEEDLDDEADGDASGESSISPKPKVYSKKSLLDHCISTRELFLNRDRVGPIMETLPVGLIRGKCHVLNHLEGLNKKEYAQIEDTFFCERSWYPPENEPGSQPVKGQVLTERLKRIQFDRDGTYQAQIPPLLSDPEQQDYVIHTSDKSTPVWNPRFLSDESVENFARLTQMVGLMARGSSKTSYSSALRESPYTMARLAGRDDTLLLAHDILHESNYDLGQAVQRLVGEGFRGRRSLLETFDECDMDYFQQGLHATWRNLQLIHREWLPWKSYADIVNFYYLFKGIESYKPFKAAKIKDRFEKGWITCVSVAPFEAKSCVLKNMPESQVCYGCSGTSATWCAWMGLSQIRRQVRAICSSCWQFWKRYGALKRPWKQPQATTASLSTRNPFTPVVARRTCSRVLRTSGPPAKPMGSGAKQMLLTHRSPPPSAPSDSPEKPWEEPQGDEEEHEDEEFTFVADDAWLLSRRVASESLYIPRRAARCPELACRDGARVAEYYESRPGFVVDYYKRKMGHRSAGLNEVIKKLSRRDTGS